MRIFSSESVKRAEVWSPIEIDLQSTAVYENPYTDADIDAVFTHSDGTEIALPGFWKEGNTWAVRFSPTKEGTWTHRITCSDADNTGLFDCGTIEADPASGNTEISKHGFVTVKKGKRYYEYADGTPFFWLGDTNWQSFVNVSTTVCNYPGCKCKNQFKHIADNRLKKGFNVYQTYFVETSTVTMANLRCGSTGLTMIRTPNFLKTRLIS